MLNKGQENIFNISALYSVSDDEIESDAEESEQIPTGGAGREATANRRKRKRGRTANRPAQACVKPQPGIELTEEALREILVSDNDLNFILQLKESDSEKPVWSYIVNKSPEIKYWIARWELLFMCKGLLCIKWEHSETDIQWRICIPTALAPTVLWYLHDAHVSGHLGIKKTIERAKRCPFYWIHMNHSVVDYVKACEICGEANNPQQKHRHLLRTYVPGGRFERITCDITGPFPKSKSGNSYILVVRDYFTKLTEMYPLSDIRAETVAEHMVRGWIKHYGCPREIHSDQGRQFVSAVFKEICKLLEINKSQTTPLHPSSDGLVERMNRTVKSMLSKFVRADQKDWDTHIDYIVMAYNTTPQESTGVSPHRLVYGDEMLMPLDIMTENIPERNGSEVNPSQYVTDLGAKMKAMYELVRENLQEASCRQKKQYDCRVKEHNFSVRNLVWRNQWQSPPGIKPSIRRHWTGPWMVIGKLCDVLFRIKHSANSPSVVIHGDNLKPYHGNRQLDFQVPNIGESEVRFPDIRGFTTAHSVIGQHSESGNPNERVPSQNRDQRTIAGGPASRRRAESFATDTSHSDSQNSTLTRITEQSHDSLLSHSSTDEHFCGSSVLKPVAEQTFSTQSACVSNSDNLAEQSDSHVFTPLAEQYSSPCSARANVSKHPAEQQKST